MGDRLFDELARALAQPLPRRRVLRLLGVAVAAAAVPALRPAGSAATGRRTGDCGGCAPTTTVCGVPRLAGCTRACCDVLNPICCKWPGFTGTWTPGDVAGICSQTADPEGSLVCCCPPGTTCGNVPGGEPPCVSEGCAGADRERCGKRCCNTKTEFCAFPEASRCCLNAHTPCAGQKIKQCCPEDEECCVFEPIAGQKGKPASACCSKSERCLSLKGTCCPKEQACGQKACCNPNEDCDERAQTCSCPKPRRCNGRCCPEGSTCKKGVCRCKDDREPCDGSVCCEKGKTCTRSGRCCAPAKVCGDECCRPDEECRNLAAGRELERAGVIRRGCARKCLAGSSPCGATCCTDGVERCENGTCVPLG